MDYWKVGTKWSKKNCFCAYMYNFFWMMFSVPVMAVSIVELPVITKWENGNGYDEKGNRLEDTWGV